MTAGERRPTSAQIEAWTQQVEVLSVAAQIAQQWNDASLADELADLAAYIRARYMGLS